MLTTERKTLRCCSDKRRSVAVHPPSARPRRPGHGRESGPEDLPFTRHQRGRAAVGDGVRGRREGRPGSDGHAARRQRLKPSVIFIIREQLMRFTCEEVDTNLLFGGEE